MAKSDDDLPSAVEIRDLAQKIRDIAKAVDSGANGTGTQEDALLIIYEACEKLCHSIEASF
jgi:hypothetical protein